MTDAATLFQTPQLLVSVRNSAEAAAAIAGGCRILDVKEPSLGSLGFAGTATIADVMNAGSEAGLPVSAALGEVVDWLDADVPRLPDGLQYVKLGLSQLATNSDWRSDWGRVRERFAPSGAGWIAVAYADWGAAGAPHPDEVIEAAIETACAGVLFDTWDKSRGSLTGLVGPACLAEWCVRIQRAGLLVALAGRLEQSDLSRLAEHPPDIVAVRSAACVGQNRGGPIDIDAVRRLRKSIERWSERRPSRCGSTSILSSQPAASPENVGKRGN